MSEFSAYIFSKSFIVSGLIFRSLIHFEFIFMYGFPLKCVGEFLCAQGSEISCVGLGVVCTSFILQKKKTLWIAF